MPRRSLLSLALLSAVALAACSSSPAAPVVTPPATLTRYTLSAAHGQALPAFEESFVDTTLARNQTIVIRVSGGELVVDRTAGTYSVAIERQYFQLDTVAGQPVERFLQRSTSRDRGRIMDGATATSLVLESELFNGLVHPLTLLAGKAQGRIREPGSDLVVPAEFTPKG